MPLPIEQAVHALQYSTPSHNRMPGLGMAVGVCSMVFACCMMFANSYSALAMFHLYSIISKSIPSAAGSGDVNGPNGYFRSERQTIVAAFDQKHALSTAQKRQLDFFLADTGMKYVPGIPMDWGQTPADYVSVNLSLAAGSNEGKTWYYLPMGKLSIGIDQVIMDLDRGREQIVRSNDRTSRADPSQLSEAEIDALLRRIDDHLMQASSPPISPEQAQGLRSYFRNQPPVTVSQTADMAALLDLIEGIRPFYGGKFNIVLQQSELMVDAVGSVTVGNTLPRQNPLGQIWRWPVVVLVIESLASAALAVYLFVVGVVTLRKSHRAAGLHRIFAWLKVGLALVAAASIFVVSLQMQPVNSTTSVTLMITGVTWLILGIAYPASLLWTLRSPSIRAFYRE